MYIRRILASFVVVLALFSAPFAMADGTGGGTHATEDAWAKENPGVAAKQALASKQKLEAIRAKQASNASTGRTITPYSLPDYPAFYSISTPVIGQGQVKDVDPYYTNPPQYNAYIRDVGPGAGQTEPCLNPNGSCTQPPRSCVHCGTDAALIAIRYMKSAGMLTIDDLSGQTDKTAMYNLGNGYLSGANTSYAIQKCCDDSEWNISPFYNLHYQIASNLNARQSVNNYIQSTSYPLSAGTLQTMISYDVGATHVPVIAGVKTGALPYYTVGTTTSNLGHVIVVDGYNNNAGTYTVNDPNDCSKYASAWSLLGHHTVSQSSLLTAINNSWSSVEW
jgi:hypothetical protein